jgi:hypothetical protein
MDGEHAIEIGWRDVGEDGLMDMAGIVHEKRDWTERLSRRIDERCDIRFARDVTRFGSSFPALRLDRMSDRVSTIAMEIIHQHAIALLRQPFGDGPADARSGARDNR